MNRGETKSHIKHFNIRVYALIFNDPQSVLVSDEFMLDRKMTKFPGGGLKFGEGPVDCIKREALEEFKQEIEIIDHYYTTDYFQQALFYKDHQLISIYYRARFKDKIRFKISEKPFDFKEMKNGKQSFRWVDLRTFTPEELSFPVDKKVLKMLRADIK